MYSRFEITDMPNNPDLRGTNFFSPEKDKVKGPNPWTEVFFQSHLKPSETVVTSARQILEAYHVFAQTKTGFSEGSNAANSPMVYAMKDNSFFSCLRTYCLRNDIQPYSSNQKSYYVELKRFRRGEDLPSPVPEGPARQLYPRAVKQPPSAQQNIVIVGKIKIIWTGRKKGYCGFANEPIDEFEDVAEYMGERISIQDGRKRNKAYAAKGISSTMVDLPDNGGISIDGQMKNKDEEFAPFENAAAYLNHSLYNPTCKLQWKNGKAMIVALKNIPKNFQLTWCYNIPKKEQPDFYHC